MADGPDEDAKIIVRSNGTVTYVGKDIAYHLWKFGLLGKDFGYAEFHQYATHMCWISTVQGEEPHPTFGKADAIYNVIDSRQDDPQTQVNEALRVMGYAAAGRPLYAFELCVCGADGAHGAGAWVCAERRR